VLAEVLKLILINVQQEYYGPTPQCNTGPCLYGQAYTNVYAKNPEFSSKFPIASGKYKWNQYTFGNSILPRQEGVIQHKCDGCNTAKGDEWLGGGNDYRDMHDKKQYYCTAANAIFVADK
jgi:hypothetical protein